MNDTPSSILNSAAAAFPQVFGEKLRRQREAVPNMTQEMLSQLLGSVGVSLSPEELAALEAGTYPNLDTRLMLALAFLLEFSVDAVLVECLRNAAGNIN